MFLLAHVCIIWFMYCLGCLPVRSTWSVTTPNTWPSVYCIWDIWSSIESTPNRDLKDGHFCLWLTFWIYGNLFNYSIYYALLAWGRDVNRILWLWYPNFQSKSLNLKDKNPLNHIDIIFLFFCIIPQHNDLFEYMFFFKHQVPRLHYNKLF